MKFFKKTLLIFSIIILAALSLIYSRQASLHRDWNLDQLILPQVSMSGTTVVLKNLRDFEYSSTTNYEVNYYDAEYDVNDLESLYYIIEPFSEYD